MTRCWVGTLPGAEHVMLTLSRELARGRGIRVGEASVVSRRLHLLKPQEPASVFVSCSSDAGEAFYNRTKRDEVLHLDVFHEIADVDHVRIAGAVREAARRFADDYPLAEAGGPFRPSWDSLIDFTDIQTATGGGRVSGKLSFGTRDSIRAAHRNHVHVAFMIPVNCLQFIFYLVDAIETAITSMGLQIRKVERIVNEEGAASLDLEPYMTPLDSMLTEGRDAFPERMPGDELTLNFVCELVRKFETRQDLLETLEAIGNSAESPMRIRAAQFDVLSTLESNGFIEKFHGEVHLAPKGEALCDYLRSRGPEIDARVRRMLRSVPFKKGAFDEWSPHGRVTRVSPKASFRVVMRPGPGEGFHPLAVPETVIEAARRMAGWGTGGPDSPRGLRIDPGDVMVYGQRKERAAEICLLIDASASMMGRRMSAAKNLIRHLALATRAKITAFIFQERSCKPAFTSTRNRRTLEDGLASIFPSGLTPLAAGLEEAIRFLGTRKRRALLVLITDGIPTMGKWSPDPARDALSAASSLARKRIPFLCIGLAPNRDFLRKLVEAGRGRLFVVDEFHGDVLVEILHRSKYPL